MSRAAGFSVRIFLPSGEPEGSRIVEKSNRTGQGLVFPRSLCSDVRKRPELSRTGVYILWGPGESGESPRVYVGESDALPPRLDSHAKNKDFWTHAVAFTSKDQNLSNARVQCLEARSKRNDLLLRAKGIEARGYDGAQGFVVRAGSAAVKDEVPSIHAYIGDLRRTLIEERVLEIAGETYRLAQDYTFNSPSTAAGVLLGRSANGRVEWKDARGRSLKGIQEAAESGP